MKPDTVQVNDLEALKAKLQDVGAIYRVTISRPSFYTDSSGNQRESTESVYEQRDLLLHINDVISSLNAMDKQLRAKATGSAS